MSNIVLSNQQFPTESDYRNMTHFASIAFKSKLIPNSIVSQEAALIIMMKGRELGIPPMQAFSHIHIVNGKPSMSAELMLAQIYRCIPKVVINYLQQTGKICEIEVQRPYSPKVKFSYTIEEAANAQLLSKEPWKKYPASMLRARAISIMARAMFPDALMGISYTAEELGADIELDENGDEIIKDVTPKEEPKPPLPPVEPYLEFVFKSDENKGKHFYEIEDSLLDAYVKKLADKYSDAPMTENVTNFFEMYNQYVKNRGNK